MSDKDVPTRVGIGLIERGGRYLIRQRRAGQPMTGYWEFPGGKCEPGETPAKATARECLEEVGVEVVVGQLFHRVVHHYPHGLVDLHYFRCRIEGTFVEPTPESGFVWVAAADLLRYRFPEANDAVIEVLRLEAGGSSDLQRGEP